MLRAPHVTRRRSVAKSISWRTLGSLDTFVLAFLITGRLSWGASIAGAEVVTKTVLYYVHERAWAHVAWGLHR
jgi:uncharacterized membrane protein